MALNCSKKFIRYLDNYNNQNEHIYTDYGILTTNILTNYYTMYPNMTLHVNPGACLQTDPSIMDISTGESLSTVIDTSMQSHVVKTKQRSIVVNIKNIDDLISLIDENEYSEDTDYNIDLQLLHSIRSELVEINNMIGMTKIKTSILDQLLYFIQNLHVGTVGGDFKHTIICGPPGTGKTEIAKLIGKMYSKLGVLKKEIFKKVTRNDLIAGYLGQTAIKTKKVIEESMGGVLFIDEAYSLASEDHNDSFAKECIDMLCESLSDCKEDLMVIIAGYKAELESTLFRVNPGLKSRFIWQFEIDGYNASELRCIFEKKIVEQGWELSEKSDITDAWFQTRLNELTCYGRDIEQLITYIKIAHSRRIYGLDLSARKKITIDDINTGYSTLKNNKSLSKKDESHLYGIYV